MRKFSCNFDLTTLSIPNCHGFYFNSIHCVHLCVRIDVFVSLVFYFEISISSPHTEAIAQCVCTRFGSLNVL